MKEITVVATSRAKTGCETLVEQAIREAVGPTHAESGCLKYMLHRSTNDPQSFAVIERWESRAALDQHLKSAHIQVLFRKLSSLLDGEPNIQIYEALPEGQPAKSSF